MTRAASQRAARDRDRRVYLGSHPFLFLLLAASRCRGVLRLGRTIIVNDTDAYRHALTELEFDRADGGTVGGLARELSSGGVLFDQDGGEHRDARRALLFPLGAEGVEGLRPVWRAEFSRRFAQLGHGGEVDLVPVAAEVAAATACTLLGVRAEPRAVAHAAVSLASAAVTARLPGRRSSSSSIAAELARLGTLLGRSDALAAIVAVTAVNTTVAALPRSVAWCCDAGLWAAAADGQRRGRLADELLRVTAPSPLLPRVAAVEGTVGTQRVRPGDRLVLVARHAVRAQADPPDCVRPAPRAMAHLVFGTGSHTCPGARLAHVQLADALRELAPYCPVVTRARADRRAALPAWRELVIRAAR